MAISLVQKKSGATQAGSLTVTFTTATTATNTLIATLFSDNSASDTFTPPSGWSLAKSQGNVGDGHTLAVYYAKNIPGGTTGYTFSRSASSFDFTVLLAEYSGLDTTAPLDKTNSATGNSASITSGSITTTQASELLIMAGIVSPGSAPTLSAGTSMTMEDQLAGISAATKTGWEDEILSSTGTYSPTMTSGASGAWTGIQASFIAASGGAPTNISVSDSATGTDTISLGTITPAVSDSATGSEAVSLGTITPAVSDSGTGTDTPSVGTVTPSVADTGAGAQTVALGTITPQLTDTGAGSEQVALGTITPQITDTATGSEGVSVNTGGTPKPVSDSAVGSEQVTLGTITPQITDTGAGTETVGLGTITPHLTDSATGSETVTTTVGPHLSDSGAGGESVGLASPVLVSISESAAGSDAPSLAPVAVGVSEHGTGAESVGVVNPSQIPTLQITLRVRTGNVTLHTRTGKTTLRTRTGKATLTAR